LSLIIIKIGEKIFSRYDKSLAKTSSIVTSINGVLTKKERIVNAIIFEDFQATPSKQPGIIKVLETKNKKDHLVDRSTLKDNSTLKLLSTCAILCRYKPQKHHEEIILDFLKNCQFISTTVLNRYDLIDNIPSHHEKKLSTVVTLNNETKEIFSFTKGNPFKILERCTREQTTDRRQEISVKKRRYLKRRIEKMQKNGQKVIAFAYKPLPKKRLETYSENFTEQDMVLIGFFGLSKPINIEVKDSIRKLKEANIRIIISSLIKERDCIAIAMQLGIVNPEYFEAITGPYFRKLTDQKVKKLISKKEKDLVFAEMKDEDKQRLFKLLKESGEKTININKNSQLNFKDLSKIIRKSRLLIYNAQKFIYHEVAIKIAETILLTVSLILGLPAAISLILIVTLELLINLPLQLALRADPTLLNLMNKDYRPNPKRIGYAISNGILIGVIITLTYLATLIGHGFKFNDTISTDSQIHLKSITITFILLAIIQIFNAINFHHIKTSIYKSRILQNPYLALMVIISILTTYLLIVLSPLSNLLGLTSLSSIEWKIIAYGATLFIFLEEVRKQAIKFFKDDKNTS